MSIPRPKQASDLAAVSAALDAATPHDRLAWCRSLGRSDLYALYALARGSPVTVRDLVDADGGPTVWEGKNGVGLFSRFKKVFANLDGEVVGYNDNRGAAGPLTPIYLRIVGYGHYVAYDAADFPEVLIDYRRAPARGHPEFPPLADNRHGLRSLVFGNMVDTLRRVTDDVFIGDATKKLPAGRELTWGERIGSALPTAPFVLCRPLAVALTAIPIGLPAAGVAAAT